MYGSQQRRVEGRDNVATPCRDRRRWRHDAPRGRCGRPDEHAAHAAASMDGDGEGPLGF